MRHLMNAQTFEKRGPLAPLVAGSRPWPCKHLEPRRPRGPNEVCNLLVISDQGGQIQPALATLVAHHVHPSAIPASTRRSCAGRNLASSIGFLPPQWGKVRMGVTGGGTWRCLSTSPSGRGRRACAAGEGELSFRAKRNGVEKSLPRFSAPSPPWERSKRSGG